MNDQDLVNVGTEHPSGESSESPRPAQLEGLAGRELDAAVAERVMGYRWCVWPKECKGDTGRFLDLSWNKERGGVTPILATGDEPLHRHALNTVSGFSTDIAAAMRVVAKMKETRNVEIWAGKNGGGWHVCFEPDSFRRASAGGPDLPDVICRAALAAVAHNEPARDAGTTTVG